VQNNIEQGLVNLDATVVFDEAELAKSIHEGLSDLPPPNRPRFLHGFTNPPSQDGDCEPCQPCDGKDGWGGVTGQEAPNQYCECNQAQSPHLERFSASIMPFIRYDLDPGRGMTVHNDTASLYRHFDATPEAEYLYRCIEETIRRDLRDEIGFIAVFDAALRAVLNIIDMPNRRIESVNFCRSC
jgi:hypothetical protein